MANFMSIHAALRFYSAAINLRTKLNVVVDSLVMYPPRAVVISQVGFSLQPMHVSRQETVQ